MQRLLIASLLIFAATSVLQAKPLPIRVWQFQDYNMDHIHRLIDMAAAQHINRIQLSHHIVMYVEQLIEKPERAADINTICGWAHAKGIQVDMWTHELEGKIPDEMKKDGKVDLDNPKLWDWVTAKYEKLFKLCPDLDGLVLTMHETDVSVYDTRKTVSVLPGEKRVAKLIDEIASVCKPLDKELFVRTFAYEPAQERFIEQGLADTKSDIIAMSKCVPHDWQPFYPYNHSIGNVGGKRQIVEFDLGHEFTGISGVPYIMLDYLKRHLDYDLTKNIEGAVMRVERHKWRSVDTPNQAVIDVFTKMLLSPGSDPHKLYKNWLADRYPTEAVEHLYSAFMRTEEILGKSYFALGYWITNHSFIPDYTYAQKSLHGRTTAKWDPSTKAIEEELFNPTAATLKKIDAEKDEALKLAELSIADIEKAKPFLKSEDYAYLSDLFQREKAMVIAWKAATDVIFGIDVYKRSKSEADAEFLAKAADRLDKVADDNKKHLIKMGADYRTPEPMTNVNNAHGLADLARKTLQAK